MMDHRIRRQARAMEIAEMKQSKKEDIGEVIA